jgi:hypothetical protein
MDITSRAVGSTGPEWLVGQMPPGYQTRFREIQRLSAELHGMDRLGRLLWESGPALTEAVNEAFSALKCTCEFTPLASIQMTVTLDGKRRLLVRVPETEDPIEKKSPALAQAFQVLHESAGEGDRVVLCVNPHRRMAPGDRPDPITPDALALLARLGVNVVPTTALFAAWTTSLQDAGRAKNFVERLQSQDGGVVRFGN